MIRNANPQNAAERDPIPAEPSGRRVASGTFVAVRPRVAEAAEVDADPAPSSERVQNQIDAFFDGYESVLAIDSSRAA